MQSIAMPDHTAIAQERISLQDALRWLAVLPAAIGAYIGVHVAVIIFHLLEPWFSTNPVFWSLIVSFFSQCIIAPYFFVWAGARTAPRHRYVTAISLAVLCGVSIGAVVALAIDRGLFQSMWLDLMGCAAGIIAMIVACAQIHDETKEPPTLTPETAKPILDVAAAALQEDDGLPLHPRSSLKGYDVFQIDTALKLQTANDLLLLTTLGREAEFDERVKDVEGIPLAIITTFIEDAKRNKLRTIPRESLEYMELQMPDDAFTELGVTDSKLGRLETLSSFAKYCRYVGTNDPLYWQKIYARLDLPYSKACPRRNVSVWPSRSR